MARKKDLVSMYRGALVSGFVIILLNFSRQQFVTNRSMHFKYAEMLTIVVHENMKFGDNTPE